MSDRYFEAGINESDDDSQARKSAAEERARKKRKKQIIQASIIAGAVVVVIIVVMLLINPITKKIEGEISEDVPLGFVTYNASRYFFRFDYKEGWYVKTDTGEFGFMQDPDSGLVVSLYPSSGDNTDNTETTQRPSGDVLPNNYETGYFADFYYREFPDNKALTPGEAFTSFCAELDPAFLSKGNGTVTDVKLGKSETYKGRNEEFCSGKIEYTITDGEGNEKHFSGKVYVSVRSMSYCAILVCCDLGDEQLYIDNEASFKTTVDSFRFSVFDD